MKFDSLKYEKDKFKERTKNLNKENIDWIISRFTKEYPELSDYKNNEKNEEILLSRINLAIYCLEKDNPTNIRAYVEKELKRKSYDDEDESLEREIKEMRPYDEKAGQSIMKRYETLISRIQKEDPEFWEERGRRFKHTRFLLGAKLSGQHERVEE